MNWFWMNMPAALVFVGLWAGIPLWLVLRRPDRGPASLAVHSPARTRPAAPAELQVTSAPQRSEQPVGV
jgi:hypothetical protein